MMGNVNGLSLDLLVHPGETIKEVLEKKKMSQEELAKKAGVSRQSISGLDSGACTVTTTDTLIKIAHALGKNVSDIFLP